MKTKEATKPGKISAFIKKHYRHFNAAVITDSAQAYADHLDRGGKMFLAMAGAMSTAEIGLSLARMIREDKVHAISCTGANLEEDMFNLVAHDHYVRIPNYRDLTPAQEVELREKGNNRVTDTCIPEEEAMRRIDRALIARWVEADKAGKSYFPYEYMYQMIRSGELKQYYQIDPADSWLVAACEKNIPVFTPGWEDSTLGNSFVAQVLKKTVSRFDVVKSGPEQMASLIDWYRTNASSSIGFFQIGGGIAGDFAICIVPLIIQDLKVKDCPLWGYFCQISDSTTSYGSYSGAVPNEKITWHKLDGETPKFVIESDATIVAPLIFSYVLND